ncbi:MAG: hypothetical protein IPL39_13305 [Opitutaceae bacterium]|nr:hypothetical protein [Opitutaceae bacterium]
MNAARKIELIWTAYVNGGNKERLAMVDAQSLVVLTPESISGRRNAYVAKAGTDPVERKSAERSAATVLRGSRALFSADGVAMLKFSLPPDPFAGVKLKDPSPQRYQSAVNPEWLLLCAESELRQQHAQQYLALVLCLWDGLRRKEADTLTWAQIDFAAGQIHIRRTQYFEPKTEESQRVVDLAPAVLDILRGFKEGSQSEFVLEGGDANPAATYDYHRADCTGRELHAWLKSHGVLQQEADRSWLPRSGSRPPANISAIETSARPRPTKSKSDAGSKYNSPPKTPPPGRWSLANVSE